MKYDPAKRHIKLGQEEGRRFKKLGDFGEQLVPELLLENGFSNIRNMNEIQMNFPYADFYGELDNRRFLISVKTRNKFERRGTLNCRYKLGDPLSKIAKIFDADKYSEYHACIPAFLAIAMEEETFDAYFGLLEYLDNPRGIPMSKSAKARYECFALQKKHPYNSMDFLNVYHKSDK